MLENNETIKIPYKNLIDLDVDNNVISNIRKIIRTGKRFTVTLPEKWLMENDATEYMIVSVCGKQIVLTPLYLRKEIEAIKK